MSAAVPWMGIFTAMRSAAMRIWPLRLVSSGTGRRRPKIVFTTPDTRASSSVRITEASRAGANFLEDEAIMANVLQLAKRSDVYITKKNVKIARIAGQIFITVHYSVPIDFIFYTWNMECDIKASSFVGRL